MNGLREILTVSALNGLIQNQLEGTFPEIWVQGEISGLAIPASGHCYFTLKDKDCQIKAVMFRFQAAYLRFRPKDGMKVLIRGRVTIYKPKGDIQLSVQYMEEQGVGDLFRSFEELKKKLDSEGLFDEKHKKLIPFLPSVIGVVTSATGAAVRDFIRIAGERDPSVRLIISHSRVQGEGAAEEIIRAVENLEQLGGVDLIVITRGGGSIEDLFEFNNENLARKIYDCEIPVVSAIGHEIDFTILDFAADLRAPTPTGAAEMVVKNRGELGNYVRTHLKRIHNGIRYRISNGRMELRDAMGSRAFSGLKSRIMENIQRVDYLSHRLQILMLNRLKTEKEGFHSVEKHLKEMDPVHRLVLIREQFRQIESNLINISGIIFEKTKHRLAVKAENLDMISPLAVLGRGYSLCQREDGKIVMNKNEVGISEKVKLTLKEGRLDCRVEGKSE